MRSEENKDTNKLLKNKTETARPSESSRVFHSSLFRETMNEFTVWMKTFPGCLVTV